MSRRWRPARGTESLPTTRPPGPVAVHWVGAQSGAGGSTPEGEAFWVKF